MSNAAAAGLHAEVHHDLEPLERIAPEWEALAVQGSRPAALAGWQLAWWRHLAPRDALLRAVVVRRGAELVAVAPFAARPAPLDRHVFRLLASEITQRVEPAVAPGQVAQVAPLIARALAGGAPPVGALDLEAADADGAWLSGLRAGWPGRLRPWTLSDEHRPAPVADLRHPSYDAWLESKSSNFRQQARRFRRRLTRDGGEVRLATPDTLERDVEAFVRLHHARWDERGGSDLAREIGPMLLDAGGALLAAERFRLWMVELDGRAIGAQLFLAAGTTVHYWNGGFDVEASAARPALVGMVAAIEDCIGRGETLLDLGGGAHEYKLRIADGDRPLTSSVLVPRDRRHLRNRAGLARREAAHLARTGLARLPPREQERLRRVLARRRATPPAP